MLSCLTRSIQPLQPHQKAAVKAFIQSSRRSLLVYHSVGTGKSKTAVAASRCFLDMHPTGHVYLITMSSLIAGFKAELQSYEKKVDMSKYTFMTYQGWEQAVSRGEIKTCEGSLCIIDEVHSLRNTEGKMYAAVHKCTSSAMKTLALTGTPMVNSETDIVAILTLINGTPTMDKHLARLILYNDKLARAFFGCQLSIYRPDPKAMAANFPKVEERFIPIVMSPKTLRTYTDIEREKRSKPLIELFHLSGENADTDLTAFFSGARALSSAAPEKIGFAADFIWHVYNNKPNARLGLTRGMLDSHTKQTIVFAHLKEHGSHLLIEALEKMKIPYGVIDGEVPRHKRKKMADDYVAGRIAVILLSQAGATGLSLKATGFEVLMDPSWTIAEEEQIKARGVRFLSHSALPKKQRNVMVLKLMLIKPSDTRHFDKLVTGKMSYTDMPHPVAIDIKIAADALRKQHAIDASLKMIEDSIPTAEDCVARKINIESLASLRTYKRTSPKLAIAPVPRAAGTYMPPGRAVASPNDRTSLNDTLLRDIIVGSGALRFTAPTAVLFAGQTDIVIPMFVAQNRHIVPHVADPAAPALTRRARLAVINWGLNFATGMRPAFPQRTHGFLRALLAITDAIIILAPDNHAGTLRVSLETAGRATIREARYECKFDLIASGDTSGLVVLAA